MLFSCHQNMFIAGADLNALIGLHTHGVLLGLYQHLPLMRNLSKVSTMRELAYALSTIHDDGLTCREVLILFSHGIQMFPGG